MKELAIKNEKNRRLNFLLVMPRLVQNVGDGYSFPLGITYISASMKKAGFKVFTLNLNHHEGDVLEVLKKEIKKNKIDVVATGGLSFQYATVREVVEAAKKINRKIITIVGGGIITSDSEPAMEALKYVNIGVFGEGERTIVELATALEKDGKLEKIDGLVYKKGNKYQKNSPRSEIMELDSLPWPDYEGFELDKYLKVSPSVSGINRRNTIFMIASRSCPFNCTFCFHTVGQKYRQRSLDGFFGELDYLVKNYKIDFICLADELFSVDPERVKEFCRRIVKYKLNWWAQFRVDHIVKNPELLPIIKKAGCEVMSFGLESGDNRVLASMRKNITIEQAGKALKLVYDAGITPEGAFIFGDIEENWETATNTLKWWKEHAEYKINLNLITVFPGTYLYKYACEKGLIKDRVKFLKDGCPQVNVSKLTDIQISKIVKEIVEAPMTLTKTLLDVKGEVIDYESGRVTISGRCQVCKKKNRWDGVRLFSSSFLACSSCGQRYNMVLTDEFRKNIDKNLNKLLKKHGKLAVWGINYHTADLFKKSKVLIKDEVFPVEISEIKRKMDLYGKKVCSPEVIKTENIKVIVIPIPAYFNEITEKIKSNFKKVELIVDVCQLVNPNYK